MSRYLVTGATGFLGKHLVALLRERGDDVIALCRTKNEALEDAGVMVRRGDILDATSVRDAAMGCQGVFHCAGKVSRRPEDAELLFRVHASGTAIALDACRAAGVARAVVASTSGVVAVSKGPRSIGVETSKAPLDLIGAWPYYRSKLFAERAAFERNGDGFSVVCVNPSLLLGPGDLLGSSTSDVVNFLEQKVPMTPAGGLSFVDARDAAAGMILAMERGRGGERYLLSAANMTVEAFFGRLERISDVPAPKLKMPSSVALAGAGAALLSRAAKLAQRTSPIDRISAEMAQHFWYVDATRAKSELGWTHRDPGETLTDTVADLYARGVVWPRVRAGASPSRFEVAR